MFWENQYKIKYRQLREEHLELIHDYSGLIHKHNWLVRELNSVKRIPTQFDQVELTQLLKLVHPDRHGGDPTATALAQKLITLRKG